MSLPSAVDASAATEPDSGSDECPTVTVLVLAHNRRDATRITLSKVAALQCPGGRLEVVVVDNASVDGTAEMVRDEFPSFGLMRLEHNLGAPALNHAFARARGRWILVLDDDCFVEDDALVQAVAAARTRDADLVSFRVVSSFDASFEFGEHYPAGLLTFWGCAWLVSRRAIDALGGLDPHLFIWGNEAEFTMRLLDAGLGHLFLSEVVAVHMQPPPTSRFARARHAANMRHWAYAATKLLSRGDAARVVGRLVLTVALQSVGRSPRAAGGLVAIIRGALLGLRARDPVRGEVSAIYRDNFLSFANPLRLIVTPGAASGSALDRRVGRFTGVRPDYYPTRTALLKL